MTLERLRSELLTSGRFRAALREIEARQILSDFSSIERADDALEIDWSFALACASAMNSDFDEAAQNAVLRIAQGALASEDAEPHHRAAAVVLLERMGNRPAIALAEGRDLVERGAWTDAAPGVQLDVIRRRLELAIPITDGPKIQGNPFQRDFWTKALSSDWLSVSAPTSAGKSYIVKWWFEERMKRSDRFAGVYVVPTRALIEEVANDLRAYFSGVDVHTIPWDAEIGEGSKEIYVMTQERLHLLHQHLTNLQLDLLFIDEAQKFGDASRGVLLQRILGDASRRNPSVQVLFASPMTNNPQLLLEGAPPGTEAESITSQTVTVNQNLLWVDQVPRHPKEWEVRAISEQEPRLVGTFQLRDRPQPVSQRVPLIAATLAGASQGNVIYVNGAADAEKAAMQVAEALGPSADISTDERIRSLRELVEKTVHRHYALTTVLARGVAFHYGNMPVLLRAEIEQLFRHGVIKYLVCTSTLLEGVNLPCRNLFIRGPTKGKGNPMTPADFWNLAGRAGRWGKEFEGNIVCVDASDKRVWVEAPTVRVTQPLKRATDRAFTDIRALTMYVAAGAPIEIAHEEPLLEAVYSLLATRVAEGLSVSTLPGAAHLANQDELDQLDLEIRRALESVDVPVSLIERHAGISPPAMQRLLSYFRGHQSYTDLMVTTPESLDATQTYVEALGRCDLFLGSQFGSGKRQYQLAYLIRDWMRGYPLALLIAYRFQHQPDKKLAAVIRETMADVEQIARFSAPKFLACYLDVLRLHLSQLGQAEVAATMPDLNMMLELGVSRATDVTLMTLGLSRTSVIAISEFIIEDNLSREECLAWLREHDLDTIDLPTLVRDELKHVRDQS